MSGLVFGFALGQGSMFLGQSWLVMNGHIAVVGEVGLGLAILSLAQWTADWGGTILFARHAATEDTIEYVASAIAVRLCLSVAIASALLLFGLTAVDSALGKGLIVGGAASVVIWAANLTGYLDGKGRSAVSGPISGLSWFAASVGLLWVDVNRQFVSGLTIGLLFLAGSAATVVLQYLITSAVALPVRMGAIRFGEMRRFAREGALCTVGDFTAQIYGRLIIWIVAGSLGSETAGLYVYVRNVIVAATQGVGFVLRVEFPGVAKAIRSGRTTLHCLRLQLWAIISSAIAVLAIAFFALGISKLPTAQAAGIPVTLFAFSILVPEWTLTSALGQVLIALGELMRYAVILCLTISVALGFMLLFVPRFGISAILAIEVGLYVALIGELAWACGSKCRLI